MTERPAIGHGFIDSFGDQGGTPVQAPRPRPNRGTAEPETTAAETVEVSVVLPAYNEERTLLETVGRTLAELEGFLPAGTYEVIVAEDGCNDSTPEIAASLANSTTTVRHHHSEERLGRGRALERAFRASYGGTLVYFDTDLATDLRHLEELVEAVRSEGYALATGSRTMPGNEADRPARRGIPSQVYNALVRTVLRSGVEDHQCGFKAFDREVLLELLPDVGDDHWFWDTEVLVRAQRAGYEVKEFPVDWTPKGDTSVDLVRDSWRMGRQIARTRWQLTSSTLADRWQDFVTSAHSHVSRSATPRPEAAEIALVTDYPPDSRGLAEHGRRLTNGYRRHAERPVTVFAPRHDGAPDGDERQGGEVRVERNWRTDRLSGLLSLFRAIRSGGYDVVHFNLKLTLFGRRNLVRFLSHLLPPAVRLLTGAVVVTTIHDLYELYDADGFQPGLLERVGASAATQLLLASHVVTVTTDEHRAVLERKYLGAGNVHHLPHGLYTHPEARDGRHDGPFRLLVFGYISPYKDYDTIFEAFDRLEIEEVELWIAGAAHPDHPEVGAEVEARCGDHEGVRYVGYVDSDDLDDLYEAVDVQLLPHLTCPGSSGSFRMAKTYQTPTVVYDAAGLDRFLAGEEVERVPQGDPAALAACLERLARDPERLAAMRASMQQPDDPTIADNARTILEIAGA